MFSSPGTYFNKINVFLIGHCMWNKIRSTLGHLVLVLVHQSRAINIFQNASQQTSVPIVCYSAAIVAFSSKVSNSCEWYVFIFVDKYLNKKRDKTNRKN